MYSLSFLYLRKVFDILFINKIKIWVLTFCFKNMNNDYQQPEFIISYTGYALSK